MTLRLLFSLRNVFSCRHLKIKGMLRNYRIWTIALVAGAVVMACNNKQPDSVKEANQANEEQADSSRNVVSTDDAKFMTEAASGGMMEVELGTYAGTAAKTKGVKDFGAMMVRDHTKMGDQLKQLAAAKNVTLPQTVANDQQVMVDDLRKKTGAEFDKDYINRMVDDHKEDIEKFKKEAESGKDPDIRALASSALPILQAHLDSAQALHKTLKK